MAFWTKCLHSIVVLVLFVIFGLVVCDDEFYSTLGVSRTANSDEIRKAYRRLAREWHPDKNTDSDAQEKFIKINEAYETLSDPKKREDYDRYGQSGAPNQWHSREEHFFHDNGFVFFNGMPFHFHSSWEHRDFTTLNFFRKTILPESFKKPHLLVIVSDWCTACERVQEVWDYASRELKALGLGTAQVNRDYDPQLARELGIRKLPDFVGVISGKLYHYTGMVTVKNLKDFMKGLFPDNLVPEVTNSSLDPFLHHWYDNKPRALLFTTKTEPPLQLRIVTFKYKANVGIGYVQLMNPSNTDMVEKFGAEKDRPTFAIFKENTSQPDVLLQSSELKIGTLDQVISENLYLDFPRLSSQAMFEKLCPQGRFLSQRRLCVILFTTNIPVSVKSHPLLSMSKDQTWLAKKVRFTYANQLTQQPFENSIKMTENTRSICKDNRTSKKIVILWHMKNNEVKYSWLDKGWCGPKDVPRLTAMLNGIHSGKFKLEMTAVVAELNNEHAKGVHFRLSELWNDIIYYSFHYINWSRNLSTVSLIITFGFVFIISCLLPSVSDKDSDSSTKREGHHPNSNDVYGLVQLNSQTQDELIHKAKQGQLIVVLLSDAASKSQAIRSPIVQTFAKIIRSYSRENIFTFGWLSIPDYILWCNEVMKVQTFGEIKPGTVLALNGPKKYLSIFKVQTRNFPEQDDGMIFDDSEDDDSENGSMVFREDRRTQKRIAEALGRQFPIWLEKLYEGMLPRVKLEKWPRIECDK